MQEAAFFVYSSGSTVHPEELKDFLRKNKVVNEKLKKQTAPIQSLKKAIAHHGHKYGLSWRTKHSYALENGPVIEFDAGDHPTLKRKFDEKLGSKGTWVARALDALEKFLYMQLKHSMPLGASQQIYEQYPEESAFIKRRCRNLKKFIERYDSEERKFKSVDEELFLVHDGNSCDEAKPIENSCTQSVGTSSEPNSNLSGILDEAEGNNVSYITSDDTQSLRLESPTGLYVHSSVTMQRVLAIVESEVDACEGPALMSARHYPSIEDESDVFRRTDSCKYHLICSPSIANSLLSTFPCHDPHLSGSYHQPSNAVMNALSGVETLARNLKTLSTVERPMVLPIAFDINHSFPQSDAKKHSTSGEWRDTRTEMDDALSDTAQSTARFCLEDYP